MWLWPVFDYVKNNKWAQVALVVLATILTVGIYLAIRDEGVRKRARAQMEVEKARERAAMYERKNQIVTEERTNADQALEARDRSDLYPTYGQLPDHLKAIASRRAGIGQQGGS